MFKDEMISQFGIIEQEQEHNLANSLYNDWLCYSEETEWSYSIPVDMATNNNVTIIARTFYMRTGFKYRLRCIYNDNECVFYAEKIRE